MPGTTTGSAPGRRRRRSTRRSPAANRLVPEFRYFIDCIHRRDWNACMERLDQSIAVSEVQTEARLACGIVFAADRR